MAFIVYPKFRENTFKGNVGDITAVNVKFAVLDSDHSDSSAYEVFGDVSADEVSGTGYTAGGIASPVITVVDNSGRTEIRLASNPVFEGVTLTNAQVVVAYVDEVTKYLIGRHIEASPQSPAGVNLPFNLTDANKCLIDWGPSA